MEPLMMEVAGLRIAILALASEAPEVGAVLAGLESPGGAAIHPENELCERVADSAGCADVVAVLLHCGAEYMDYHAPAMVRLCRRVVDAGVLLVVGHHPHVFQWIERYGRGLIAYSLGNLLLPPVRFVNGRIDDRKPQTRGFMLLGVSVSARGVEGWDCTGGRWGRRYELLATEGPEAAAFFRHEIVRLVQPTSEPRYEVFWPEHRGRRSRQPIELELLIRLPSPQALR